MTLVRNIVADLREKRLWPLAAALLLGLVALPVALGRVGTSAPPPPPAPVAVAPAPGAAAPKAKPIRIVEAVPRRAPKGRFHDPFAGAAKKSGAASSSGAASAGASSASGAAASAPDSSAAAAGSAASSSAGSSPVDASAPSPGSSPSAAPVTSVTSSPSTDRATPISRPRPTGLAAGYRVAVDFGPAGDVKHTSDLLRLKALTAGTRPLVIFLGVRRTTHRLLFLLATAATATGDGRCLPSAKSCQVVEIARGDSEFFDVQQPGGGTVQYELDVGRVAIRRAATRTAAQRVLRRESKAGREAFYTAIRAGRTYVTQFMYRRADGLVHRVKNAPAATAAAPAAATPAE